ncbi:unnamed protein product [Closterium sp. Yama58-4]|nr:unnamed protein product [Closterium sp. Yama58-4]
MLCFRACYASAHVMLPRMLCFRACYASLLSSAHVLLDPSRPLNTTHIPHPPVQPPSIFGLLTSLELDSPFARRSMYYQHRSHAPLPPVHLFPALHSLSLLIHASKLTPLTRCSSLTSLTLWNPTPSTLSSLASSSSLRLSLKSLFLHSAKLESCLSSIRRFTTLTSLSFLSCSINPFELHTLSRSLHSLTHLTIHDCPLVSSHSLASLVQANPALSSLSLHGTSYRLFSTQGFRSLLHLSAPRLTALDLSGLPSLRPGMLAHCSGLRSLSLIGKPETISVRRERGGEAGTGEGRGGGGREGEGDVEERVVLQQVSFESLVGMLALRVAVSEQDAATAREDAVIEAFVAATTAGVFMERAGLEGEGEGGGRMARLEDFDGMLPDEDSPSDDDYDDDGGGGADVADGAEGSGALQDFHFTRTTPEPTWLPPSLPSASPLMCLVNSPGSPRASPSPLLSTPSSSRSSSRFSPAAISTISSLSAQPQSFESVALAAVFGRLKRLSLVSCFCLKEEQLVLLLRACPALVALIVKHNEDFSDRVVARSKLHMLTDLTMLECDAITGDGVGRLLGSFPKLRELMVEASKTTFQASLAHVSLTNKFLPPLTDLTQPSAMEANFVESRKTAVYGPTTEASGYSSTGNSTWDSVAGLQLIRHVSSNIPSSSCNSSQSGSSCDSFCLDEMVSDFIEEDRAVGVDAGDGYDTRRNKLPVSQARSAKNSKLEPTVAAAHDDGAGRDSARCVSGKRENHVYDAPADTWRCQFCGGAQCNGLDCQLRMSYHHGGLCANQQPSDNSSCSEIERLASMIEPLSCCETPEEYAVYDIVSAAMEHATDPSADASTSSGAVRNAVVQQLRSRGYDAAVCYSQWDYSNGVPDGSHEYCDVVIHPSSPHRLPERLIVDLDFRAQFQVARPTPQYSYILQLTPVSFVGCPDRLHRLVEILSEAMRLSLHAQGMHVPPWRRHPYLSAKWTAVYSRHISSSSAGCSREFEPSAAAAKVSAATSEPATVPASNHMRIPAQLNTSHLGFPRALNHARQHRPGAAVVGLLARGMKELALHRQAVV